MPRITPERREARRAQIIAAARRCFARGGFHQTSMPDIAAAAGVSAGAPYRYFANKEEIILAIAADTFRLIFEPMQQVAAAADAPSPGHLVAASLQALNAETLTDAAGQAVPVEELLQCVVQTWPELLRNDHLHTRALEGFETVRRSIADALHRGQAAGAAPTADPDNGARAVIALLHGYLLQRVAFGLTDTPGFNDAFQALLEAPERPDTTLQ
ncbi:TetR/AcrR family transcriptional regulator [Streptomyces griseorubiginosus]|uniref:TetR/AcrR family transcriptional regulator n=1 Tax=Streptomyces griseorubiginosus TaxID=67304 RepID=UPI001AD77395|nr:TetR/AcrR family transcriptional regulator [Streptomyces griseorubiginosus]MBO4254230.1 TetR family transcriptional regulator [Streptomyces griseorubiginosus]